MADDGKFIACDRFGNRLFEVPAENMREMVAKGWMEFREDTGHYEITPTGLQHVRDSTRH